ncbi:glycoside hydrolase family 43 protein [Paraglaciecola aquimarina]|uniref:Glycoside hydrolase family 43 protein n=1 Tax=Paraglaciecola algarum TaxID=3050085 RepID=A0ABS9D3I6_9ALTE|nr:glycoside hydrolase family 43 protein [Paraglaciecola sp. G1-23]MCF2947489.1 glycoside hydrolase family 43 protein [Paraglaciecola sp. G1-23]
MINNPIIKGFNPDPVICRNGPDYYIATSTFEWFPGVRIYHSTNFQDWNLVAQPLNRVSQLDMHGIPDSGGVWAPCLSYQDGLFWLVYSNVKSVQSPWKCGDTFLVTAANITGPWSEPIRLKIGGFDPSLYHDTSGRKYLTYRTWGPRHHSNPHNNIVLQEYFHEQQSLSNQRKIIFTGTQRKLTEGPHIYQKDEYYYLLVAEGGTEYKHAVTVLRSKNVDGPYELHPDEIILSMIDKPFEPLQKAGHGAMIHTHSNEWYLVYLVGRPLNGRSTQTEGTKQGYCPLGRETAIDKIEWRNNWPYLVGGGQAKELIPAPSFFTPAKQTDESFIDNFDKGQLDPEWQTLRIPFNPEMGEVLTAHASLRLIGQEPLISRFDQSTIGHRWKHINFDALTSLSFKPNHEQQNAGMTMYYNTENWVYCFVDFDKTINSRSIKIIQVDNGQAQYFYYDNPILIAQAVENISIKVSVRQSVFTFYYSIDEQNWTPLKQKFAAWKLSDDYVQGKGFFTGAFVCLHCSDLSHEGIHADFHHFDYQPITISEA